MKIALPAADLAGFVGEDPDWVRGVLEKLARGSSRIVQCVRSPRDNQAFLFEIFHDVLARPILDWIAAERERVQRQAQIREQQRLAEEEKTKQEARLRKQQRLAEKKRREARLYRRLTYCFAFVAIVCFVLGVVAISSYREAAQQKARVIALRADTATDNGDTRLGLLTALAALPEQESLWQRFTRPVTDEATGALARSLYRPLGMLLRGHEGRLWHVAFSPDGSSVATASEDKSARLWDAKTGTPLKDASGSEIKLQHQEQVTFICFSAARPFLATITYDGRAYIWDAKTGQEKAHWKADRQNGRHVISISPDAETIVTSSIAAVRP